MDALLAAGASTAHTQVGTRRTALHLAVLGGEGAVVTRLLRTDADVSPEDTEGLTALDLAHLRWVRRDEPGGEGQVVEGAIVPIARRGIVSRAHLSRSGIGSRRARPEAY